MLTAIPQIVLADATSLIMFRGLPNVSVLWSVEGGGTITPITNQTDSSGSCTAIFTPSQAGDNPVVTVQFGI